jgi:hypothetical protein
MRIEKANAEDERRVLTALIVDGVVLARVSSRWRKNLFASPWANMVAEWCHEYNRSYKKAPGADIEQLFRSWATESQDADTVKLVERFLRGLSDEYESLSKESNSDYVTDLASKYFNKVALEKLNEEVQGDLAQGKVERAWKRVAKFNRLELGTGSGVDVLQDHDAMREAFEDDFEPLFEYPGDLGKFFGKHLQRNGFIAMLAPEKRGKSFWLADFAYMGVKAKRKVAFFSVGDMSQNQQLRRLGVRFAAHPLRPCKVEFPVKLSRMAPEESDESDESGEGKRKKQPDVVLDTETRVFTEGLTWRKAFKAARAFTEKVGTKEPLLRLATYPTSSISVRGIESRLEDWEREGWVADIVIIDYADILLHEEGDDERDKTNNTWKQLRALSQRRHLLVVTATQANAGSYVVDLMRRNNFSEDKRKLAHVTGMFALNQRSDEKAQGIYRLNWIVLREGEYSEDQVVHVAGCLALARPAIRSCF